jgi:hypothetical protein
MTNIVEKNISSLAYWTWREAKEMHEDYIETNMRDFLKGENVLAHLMVRSCEEGQTSGGFKKSDFHDQLHLLTV